jgi:hypothetical protein
MGSARGSPSVLTRASGFAPAPGLRPLRPLSKSNARGSPDIPVPASLRDCQAGHLPHFPLLQRLSRTVRDHAFPEGQRRNSHGAGAARVPDTGRFRLFYVLGPVMLVTELALERGAGFLQAGRGLRLRMLEARSRFFLGRMLALRSPGGRPSDRPRTLPLYGSPARGQGRARACDIGVSIFDPTAIVNPQSSLAPETSPGRS